jgi:hypothetical protein
MSSIYRQPMLKIEISDHTKYHEAVSALTSRPPYWYLLPLPCQTIIVNIFWLEFGTPCWKCSGVLANYILFFFHSECFNKRSQ